MPTTSSSTRRYRKRWKNSAGIPTIKPAAVVISALAMPPAKRCVGHARAHEGAEDLDHAQHGPQQTEQGCNAGDGAQGVEIALES